MDLHKEISRCKNDFGYFCTKYLKIVTKDSKLAPLKLNPAQMAILDNIELDNNRMLLKARQLGSTTAIAARFFWDALFNPHTSVAVVAHTDEAVKRIFEIYRRYYDNLPDFLRLETTKARENEIKFVTGSGIKVGSASTQSFRGGTYQRIHASEYAFWNNMEVAMASLFQTATRDAVIILESTANGMNEAYDMWTKDNGYTKIFLGWKEDRGYVIDKPSFDDPSEEELEYSYENKLSEQQFNWMVKTLRTKCANNWNIFNQEYPATAEMAFIISGQRFFPKQYPVTSYKEGYAEYYKPKRMGVYIMGVDTATGSPGGDYSAFCIIDATRRESNDMCIAASFYDRIPPSLFSKVVLKYAKRYSALLVVEVNSYGMSVAEAALADAYPMLYRSTSFDKITNKWQNRIGYTTTTKSRPLMLSRLYEYVTRGWLEVNCPRFQCEANRFQYGPRGKPEASPGQHDDMVMATGFALMGLDQMVDLEQEILKQYKPRGIADMLEWEQATGKKWSQIDDTDFAPDSGNMVLGAIYDS